MSDNDWLTERAIKIALEKFKSGGRPERERKPIIDALPWSPDFGPHVCIRCYGAGFMVNRDERNYGQLIPCDGCEKVKTARLPRCWKVSGMNITVPNPPRFNTFEPYTDEAKAVISAVATFLRNPSGWLTLHGSSGTGKSHTLEAIARYFLTTNVPCVYITSTNLWEYLGGVARGEHEAVDYAEHYRWIVDLPALVIDEMNLERSSDFVFKTRRGLLDARYRAALNGQSVTVLASNDAPATWQDAAVGDRALDSRFVAIHSGTKSYRQVKREQA